MFHIKLRAQSFGMHRSLERNCFWWKCFFLLFCSSILASIHRIHGIPYHLLWTKTKFVIKNSSINFAILLYCWQFIWAITPSFITNRPQLVARWMYEWSVNLLSSNILAIFREITSSSPITSNRFLAISICEKIKSRGFLHSTLVRFFEPSTPKHWISFGIYLLYIQTIVEHVALDHH